MQEFALVQPQKDVGDSRLTSPIDHPSHNTVHGPQPLNLFRKEIEARWFAYYLKGKGNLKQAEATIFQSSTNRWMTYDAWSLRQGVERRNIYLEADGRLSFEKPQTNQGVQTADTYVSEPSNPVPYRKRPVEATYDRNGSHWYTWLAQGQRFLGDRKDLLRWQSAPLEENLTISGDIIAHLFASTTGTDSDWVVKLIDVYPAEYPDAKMAGYQLMVASEIFRGRCFGKPQAIAANQVNEYTIDLHGNDYCFMKGHRIHGASPEQLVSALRSQSPEVC